MEDHDDEEFLTAEILGLPGNCFGIMDESSVTCQLYDTVELALNAYLDDLPATFTGLDDVKQIFVGAYKKLEDSDPEFLESRELVMGICIHTTGNQ